MNIMIFDIESNGLPVDKKCTDMRKFNNWPRVIEIAWELTDQWGADVLSEGHYHIKPDGWEVPTTDFFVKHGHSTAKCQELGVPIRQACGHFIADLQSADVLVAHNLPFDYNVVGAECLRLDLRLDLRGEKRPVKICTMESSTAYCKRKYNPKQKDWPGQKWKPPSLAELYKSLFADDL